MLALRIGVVGVDVRSFRAVLGRRPLRRASYLVFGRSPRNPRPRHEALAMLLQLCLVIHEFALDFYGLQGFVVELVMLWHVLVSWSLAVSWSPRNLWTAPKLRGHVAAELLVSCIIWSTGWVALMPLVRWWLYHAGLLLREA